MEKYSLGVDNAAGRGCFVMMIGIDSAIKLIRENYAGQIWAELLINRLDYHRRQAEGVKPKYNKGQSIKDWYTCGNCGKAVNIEDNFCSGCGFKIKWDSIRCLTGLPLVDAAEVEK